MKVIDLTDSSHIIQVKKRNLKTVILEVVVLIGAALVYSMAFPGFIFKNGIGFLALVALIPVFAIIRNAPIGACMGYGFFFGFVFYLFFNYWLATFHALAIILVPFIKATEMLMLFLALKLCDKWLGSKSYIAQAACWVAYAFLSQSWFAGYPYGTIAYALYRYRVLIQIADFSGIWGITFLMVLPQAFVGKWLCDAYNEGFHLPIVPVLKKEILPLAMYGLLVLASIVYGIVMLSFWNNQAPDITWRIAAVQHNADSWKGGYPTYKRNFNNLRKMTYEALLEDPDMVIWSETAFVPSVAWHTEYPNADDYYDTAGLVDEFVNFGKSLPVPLLTGNPEGVLDGDKPYNEDGSWNRKDYNTVIFFEDGEIKQTYRKQHLVPFTEHFPYEKQMPWLYNILLANDYNWWEKGTESVVFQTEQGVRFSTPVCFEDVFGYLNADFVKNGADLILNMTNDSWSGSVAAEMQHAAIAVFRSVENRRTTLRATNSGISCMITPTGRIEDPMAPFKMYWHIYEVPVFTSDDHTFYTDNGDVFAWVFVWITAGLLALGGGMALYSFIAEKRRKK